MHFVYIDYKYNFQDLNINLRNCYPIYYCKVINNPKLPSPHANYNFRIMPRNSRFERDRAAKLFGTKTKFIQKPSQTQKLYLNANPDIIHNSAKTGGPFNKDKKSFSSIVASIIQQKKNKTNNLVNSSIQDANFVTPAKKQEAVSQMEQNHIENQGLPKINKILQQSSQKQIFNSKDTVLHILNKLNTPKTYQKQRHSNFSPGLTDQKDLGANYFDNKSILPSGSAALNPSSKFKSSSYIQMLKVHKNTTNHLFNSKNLPLQIEKVNFRCYKDEDIFCHPNEQQCQKVKENQDMDMNMEDERYNECASISRSRMTKNLTNFLKQNHDNDNETPQEQIKYDIKRGIKKLQQEIQNRKLQAQINIRNQNQMGSEVVRSIGSTPPRYIRKKNR